MEDTKIIIELLEDIKKLLEPETFEWKLKNKHLLKQYFFDKLNYSQINGYNKMLTDIARQHNLDIKNLESWTTDALRHLFYSSCKWVGIKDGADKKRISREIFDIISSKKGKLENKTESNNINEPTCLFE